MDAQHERHCGLVVTLKGDVVPCPDFQNSLQIIKEFVDPTIVLERLRSVFSRTGINAKVNATWDFDGNLVRLTRFGGWRVVRIDLHVLRSNMKRTVSILGGCRARTLILYRNLEIFDPCRLKAEFQRLSPQPGRLGHLPEGFLISKGPYPSTSTPK